MTAFSDSIAKTHVGHVRANNQDRVLTLDRVLVVADGMGGHEGGEIAAQIAIDTVAEHAEQLCTAATDPSAMRDAFHHVFQLASQRVETQAEGRQMGTTLVVAVLCDNGHDAFIAHTGDSRAYLLQNGQLSPLTRDHNVYNLLLDRGKSEAEATAHPHREKLTQAIGFGFAEPDVAKVEIAIGDTLLLCSDGLCGYVASDQISRQMQGTTRMMASRLLTSALEAGGHDNVSVVLAQCDTHPTDATTLEGHLARIRDLFLFRALDEAELRNVSSYLTSRKYRPGATMVLEGEDGDECIIIVDGDAEVSAGNVRLADVGPGHQFGELALTGNWSRSATVKATGPVVAMVLSRERFQQLCRVQPSIGVKVQRALNRYCATRLAAITHRIDLINRAVRGDFDSTL